MYLKRRELLKGLLASVGASLLPGKALADQSAEMPTRVLGRTGLKVSVLGFGALQCGNSFVLRHGLDQGINYIDTADCYMGGRNEKIVGEAIAGIRERAIVATKVHIADEARMRRSVDRSIASLGVEKVDIMQLHDLTSRKQVVNPDARRVMEAMRDEGKFRFPAVSTHANQEEVLEAVVKEGFYDVVLVGVNFRSPPSLFNAIEAAAAAGVGIVAMKTQNGGYRNESLPHFTAHQAALRFIVEKPWIHTAVPGMVTKSMVDSNIKAVQGLGGIADLIQLDVYQAELRGKACSFCSSCFGQCRYGTGGLDAVRIATYAEGYGDPRLAAERAVEVASAVRTCVDCEGCSVTCSQGIDIKEAARKAERFLV